MNANELVMTYRSQYSEWEETLGADFPEFLVHKLAADLAKERSKTEYLKKVLYASSRSY